MTFTQPSLFGDDQPDLFGPAPVKPAAYRVKPEHVINRFLEFDEILRAAEVWPWDCFRANETKSRTWPYLLAKLREIDHHADADHWAEVMAAHAARLDANSVWPPDDDFALPTPRSARR